MLRKPLSRRTTLLTMGSLGTLGVLSARGRDQLPGPEPLRPNYFPMCERPSFAVCGRLRLSTHTNTFRTKRIACEDLAELPTNLGPSSFSII